MKTTMSEMKNTLDGISRCSDTAEEKLSELEGIAIETMQGETQKEKRIF